MPNDFLSSVLGNIKSSAGSLIPSASSLISNKFTPKQIISPDSDATTARITISDFNDSGNKTIEDIISSKFNNVTPVFDSTVLNRSFPIKETIVNPSTNLTTNTNISGNTTVNSTTINDILSPNILNDYDNITYNFRLMIAPEDDLINNVSTPITNLYVLAQSGVTAEFSIKDVEISSVVGPNERTKNTLATLFKIHIVENQGLSLVDKLLTASQEFGINNVMNCPMILELTFRGYTTDGLAKELNIAKRTWKIQLTDIPATMDIYGTEYHMSFASICDYGFYRFSSASIIKQENTCTVETVGDFFDQLGYQLTLQDTAIATEGDQTRNEYQFVIQPDMRDWVIGQVDSEVNAPSMFPREALVAAGQKIEDIVDNVFSTTSEIQQIVAPQNTKNKLDKPQSGSNICKIFNISCDSQIVGYNDKNNEYIRKFTYYINLYDAFRALTDKPDNSSSQDERISYILEDSLKKKYSYVFTGDNTEVLSLNIELNNLWRHAVTYYTTAMHRVNNNASNFIDPNALVTVSNTDDVRNSVSATLNNGTSNSEINNSNSFKNNINQRLSTDFDFENSNASTIIGPFQPNTGTQQKAELQQRLDALKSSGSKNTTALREIIASLDTFNQTTPIEGVSSNSKIPGLNSLPSTNIIDSQTNRINNQSDGIKFIESISTETTQPLLNMMFIKQSDPSLDVRRVNQNIETTTDLSRSIFGIISNQMYAGIYSDLLKIEIEIRGDPYWLGETDVEIIKRLRSGTSREPSQEFANYLRGENSFFLTFRTPKSYNATTGFVDTKDSTTFAGLYNVTNILHSFSDGKFIQKVTAIRDMNTDPEKIKKYLK